MVTMINQLKVIADNYEVNYIRSDVNIKKAKKGDICLSYDNKIFEEEFRIFIVEKNDSESISFNLLGEDGYRYSYSNSAIFVKKSKNELLGCR